VTYHFLQTDLGGSLYHVMRELPSDGSRWDASPAPAVTLRTKDGGSLRASTAAELGPTTSVVSTALAGTTLIGIGVTTALRRWEEYVAGPNAAGEWERVRLDAVGSGYVKTLDPLVYSYSAGNTFKSCRLSTQVTAGDVATVEWLCFAEWRYAVDGQVRKVSTPFNVSRYAPRLNITALDVVQFDPAARQQVGSDQKIDLILRDLWERHVLPDVAKLLGSPGAMVTAEAVDAALLYKFEEYVYRQSRNTERADKYAELYVNQLEEVSQGIVDIDQSGGQSDDELPPSPRSRRMVRG
jgi:hypothetical protein